MKWRIESRAPKSFFKKFPEFSPLVGQLLYNRGLKTQQQIDEFFNPDFSADLHDPFLLKDMSKAVKRIDRALNKNEKILIYGDFDTDGVCATAILYQTLKSLGGRQISIYIPDRGKENHGLNPDSIRKAAAEKVDLIISVDCGSSDVKEAAMAKDLGIDLIITDHHYIAELPPAKAIINPYQSCQKYPFQELAGAGVAYKLACALLGELGDPDNLKKWLLDLTALATVADVMPIIGENRTIVKYGLGVLAQTRWLGLEELMKISSITPEILRASVEGEAPGSNLDARTLAYILGPRLNAPGRMDHAKLAYQLLVTEDFQLAQELAIKINRQNLERRQTTERVVSELEDCLSGRSELPEVIFEGSKDWPVGILGLAASKAVEKYQRPAVLYYENGNKICASIRAIKQFKLMEVLNNCASYFDEYGGRSCTGGFRMKKDKLTELKKQFIKFSAESLKAVDLTPILKIEAELDLADISFENYNQIQQFAPFGVGNPDPVFLARSLEVLDARLVGNGQNHLKLDLMLFDKKKSAGRKIKAIGFGLGEYYSKIKSGDLVDLAFKIILNQWNGFRGLEMKLVDLRFSVDNKV